MRKLCNLPMLLLMALATTGFTIVYRGDFRIDNQGCDERQSFLRGIQCANPSKPFLANELGERSDVVSLKVSSSRVTAPNACVVISFKNVGTPVVIAPLTDKHHHISDAAKVGITRALESSTATSDANFGHVRPSVPATTSRSGCPSTPIGIATAGRITAGQHEPHISRWNTVNGHPPGDGAKSAVSFSRNLPNTQLAVFIQRPEPLAILIGEIGPLRPIPFSQFGQPINIAHVSNLAHHRHSRNGFYA